MSTYPDGREGLPDRRAHSTSRLDLLCCMPAAALAGGLDSHSNAAKHMSGEKRILVAITLIYFLSGAHQFACDAPFPPHLRKILRSWGRLSSSQLRGGATDSPRRCGAAEPHTPCAIGGGGGCRTAACFRICTPTQRPNALMRAGCGRAERVNPPRRRRTTATQSAAAAIQHWS